MRRCHVLAMARDYLDERVVIKYGSDGPGFGVVVFEERTRGGWVDADWLNRGRIFSRIIQALGPGVYGKYELLVKQRWWFPWSSYMEIIEHGRDALGDPCNRVLSKECIARCSTQEEILKEIFANVVTPSSIRNLFYYCKQVR